MAAARRGDAAALEDLLERYLGRLRAFVRLRMDAGLRARESASDLVQSVCVELLCREDFEYRSEEEFRSWLFTAALNKIREHQRYWMREKRDPRKEQPLDAGPTSDTKHAYAALGTPSQEAIAREEAQRLEAAFDRLPEHYREVITLARILGLPHKEIAARMGKTEVATRRLLGRALVALSEMLEKPAEAGPPPPQDTPAG